MSKLTNIFSMSPDQQKQILEEAGYDLNQIFDYGLDPLATFIKLDDVEEAFEYISDFLEIDECRLVNLNSLDDLSQDELLEFLNSIALSDAEAGKIDYWSMPVSLEGENFIAVLQIMNGPFIDVEFNGIFRNNADAVTNMFKDGFLRDKTNWVKQ